MIIQFLKWLGGFFYRLLHIQSNGDSSNKEEVFKTTEEYTSSSGKVVDESIDPTGTYRLIVTQHKTKPGYTDFTKGVVYKDQEVIAVINRNYDYFPYAWVKHPKGLYLLCGEDYQNQTIVDLSTGEKKSTTDGYFCWAEIIPSPTGELLAVTGCVWGAPYETLIYDFSDPMSLNWPILLVADNYYGDKETTWDDDSITLIKDIYRINLPGTQLHGKDSDNLSDEDRVIYDEILKDSGFNEHTTRVEEATTYTFEKVEENGHTIFRPRD